MAKDVFDDGSKYDRQRLEVMTPKQQKLATKIQTWYRDSFADKDNRGVFDKMDAVELYWEGEAHPPESDTDPASSTNIVNSAVEGQVAYLVEQNIEIEARPRTPSDLPFRDQAVVLMKFCKEQNKLRRKLDVHERRRKKFGVGIFRVLFNPDAIDGLGLAEIEPVSPAYVFVDPVVTDIYKIQEGRFVIETINRSIDSARRKYGDELADAITPGYYPMEYEDTFNESSSDLTTETGRDQYLHLQVWTHHYVKDEDGEEIKQLRLIEMSACGVILRDTLDDETPIVEDDSRFPYFFTPDMYREGTVWAKAMAELLLPIQDTVDDIEDQIIINGRLTGNPQRLVHTASGIDPDKLSNEPGLSIPTDEMDGMKFVAPPNMPQYIINHRSQKLMTERTIVSRWSDQMNGIKQQGVDTATESLGLQQAGTQNISHDKMLLEETLSDIFSYALTLMMENYTESEVFSIADKPGEFEVVNASEMREIPELIPASEEFQRRFEADFPMAETVPKFMPSPDGITKRIALDIEVSVGAGLPKSPAFIFQMIDKAYAAGAISPPEYRKLIRDYTGLPIEEEPPAPPMPQQPAPEMPVGDPTVAGLTQGGNPMMPRMGGDMGV